MAPLPVKGPVIAVTGGTGFIGRHLVAALQRQGAHLRLLVRPRSERDPSSVVRSPSAPHRSGQHEQPQQPEIIWGDLRDPAAVTRLLEGADVVFHLAAYARAWAANPQDFHTVNVEGTRHVVNAARACGVRRVVHVSTELVHSDAPDRTAYQRSKREAERVIREYLVRGGDAVIARPTRVYGPGPLNQANSVTRMIALYRRGRFRARLADGDARANYVYVSDLADGLLRAADRGQSGAAYLLGGENLSLMQLLDLVSAVTGRRHAVIRVPLPLARAVAGACELAGRLGMEPLITRDWVDLLVQDRPLSSQRAQAELGYRPREAREGVAATVAWLAAGGPASIHSPDPQWQVA